LSVSQSLLIQGDPTGVNRFGCVVVRGLMKAFLVVPVEIDRQAFFCFGDTRVIVEIDLFLFHRSPETFQKGVIQGSPPPIHTDSDGMGLQKIDEVLCRMLGSLIGVENLGSRSHERTREGGAAELGIVDGLI